MFCPKCGVRNSEDVSFCRSCGSDLTLVSQALGRNTALVVAQKIDRAIKRNPTIQLEWLKNRTRRAAGELLGGAAALFSVIWFLKLGHGDADFAYGLISAICVYLMVLGIWDFRSVSKSRKGSATESDTFELKSAGVGELPAVDTSEMIPVSDTETTTRHLREPRGQRQAKADM
jgi:hypothetical protein